MARAFVSLGLRRDAPSDRGQDAFCEKPNKFGVMAVTDDGIRGL